jgi:CheY-like chemotaxis protein
MMPVMDGWTFAQRCHADASGHGIPIVVLSASSRASNAQRDLADTGVCAVVAKPFRLDTLLTVIAAHLRG